MTARYRPGNGTTSTPTAVGGVGFWAELYVIVDDNYETLFRNMRPIGLGNGANFVPTSDQRRRFGLSEGRDDSREARPEGSIDRKRDP